MTQIVHWLDWAQIGHGNARYVCNQAVYPTASKCTMDPREVTCKNCIRKPNKALQAALKKGAYPRKGDGE